MAAFVYLARLLLFTNGMNQTMTYGLTFLLVLSMAFFVNPEGVGASTAADDGTDLMSTITAVSERERNGKHDLIIQGDGQIPSHSAWLHTSPPKIIIDIHHGVPAFKSIAQPISFPEATSIRIGCHPSSIRVVIDLTGPDNPLFSIAVHENTLVVTLNDGTVHGNGSENNLEPNLIGSVNHTEPGSIERKAAPPETIHLFKAAEYLIEVEGYNFPQAFGNGVSAYRSGNWSAAFAYLNEFLEASPDSPLVEKACFLAAKAFDRMHSDDIGSHYTTVKQQYEDAIYLFPESVLVSDAYYAIADLSFRVGMVSQSLGYCNLVVKLDKQDHATLAANMLKARLLSSVGKKEDALRIYQTVQRLYPHLPEGIRAKIETADILFEKNHFQESLDILKTLVQDPENVTQHPQLSRVLGNNYYQMADFARAREHLLRYYNTDPGAADSHLVLARIADAYQEEGKVKAATKIYRLVIDRYPETEGAMISMYRMAEQQERGEVANGLGSGAGIMVMDNSVGMPREIYEKVVQTALAKNETSPLVQYALLKLSIIDIKEKQYGRSLNRLKGLMEQYPDTRLKMEVNQAYEEALVHILEVDFKVKKYKRIVNTYQAEKENLVRFTSPDPFLIIARAALGLNLDELAGEMYKMADPYLADQEKPSDLLFHLAGDLMESGNPQAALVYADMLIKNNPEGRYLVDGCVLKGNILSGMGNHKGAAVMFSTALDSLEDTCDRPAILIQKVKALAASGLKAESYQTLRKADVVLKACERVDQTILAEVGELYLNAGRPESALEFIQTFRKADSPDDEEPRLQLVMARCYERLDSKDSYVSIYSHVAGQDDQLYGKVAREKMDEINFNAVIQKEM